MLPFPQLQCGAQEIVSVLNILASQYCLLTDILEGMEYKDEGVNAICRITPSRQLGHRFICFIVTHCQVHT